MRLADVDREDVDLIVVPGVQFVEDPSLGSEGASREAAEDEDHRLASGLRQGDCLARVVRGEREIRGILSRDRPAIRCLKAFSRVPY